MTVNCHTIDSINLGMFKKKNVKVIKLYVSYRKEQSYLHDNLIGIPRTTCVEICLRICITQNTQKQY